MCTRPAFFLSGEARKRAEESYRLCVEARTQRVSSRQEQRTIRTESRAEAREEIAKATGTTPGIEFTKGLSDLWEAAGDVGEAYFSGGLGALGGDDPGAAMPAPPPPPPPESESELPSWAVPAGVVAAAALAVYAITR